MLMNNIPAQRIRKKPNRHIKSIPCALTRNRIQARHQDPAANQGRPDYFSLAAANILMRAIHHFAD